MFLRIQPTSVSYRTVAHCLSASTSGVSIGIPYYTGANLLEYYCSAINIPRKFPKIYIIST